IASLAPSPAAPVTDQPTYTDGDEALNLVTALTSDRDAALVARALAVVRGSTYALANDGGVHGLIHGDLHHKNVLFHRGEARAIDFDDCGWGFHLYDLAVTLSELEDRPRYGELRDALL